MRPSEKEEIMREARSELARMGGKARVAGLTAKERSELGRTAAKARWGKRRPKPAPAVA